MSDPNEEIVLRTTRAGLARLVETAWHDSSAETGIRAADAAVRRADVASAYAGEGPFRSGTWNHLFDEDGRERERSCEVVVDQAGRIVALLVQRDGKLRDASADETKDVQESLDDNDVGDDPEEHGLAEGPLPGWACDQIADRLAGLR